MRYINIGTLMITVSLILVSITYATSLKTAPLKEEMPKYVPGQLLVMLEPNTMAFEEIEAMFRQADRRVLSITPMRDYENLNMKGSLKEVYIIEFPKNLDMEKVAEKYRKLSYVKIAGPNYIGTSAMSTNDPFFYLQWGLSKIKSDSAWDLEMGDSSIIIAIIDSGVDIDHPDLMNKLFAGYDFVNEDNDPNDDYNHGTHVAGIALARTFNGIGIASACPDCMILPVKAINNNGTVNEYDAFESIEYAIGNGPSWGLPSNSNPAKILSMSFSFATTSGFLDIAILDAYSPPFDTILIAAADNQGGTAPRYPAAFNMISGYPVEVIAVGATDQSDAKRTSSNYGSWVDTAAPGEAIYSTVIDGYDYKSGTSMSTPFVSGVAGLLLSYNPSLTSSQILNILQSTGDPTTGFTPAINRVNAFNALTSISVDLSLGQIYYNPNINMGQPTTLFFRVTNTGPINLTDVEYKINTGDPAVGANGVLTYNISSIATGSTIGVYASWTYQSTGSYNGNLTIDSNLQYFEMNENNNLGLFTITVN